MNEGNKLRNSRNIDSPNHNLYVKPYNSFSRKKRHLLHVKKL